MIKRNFSEKAIILTIIIVIFYLIVVLYSDINSVIDQTNKIDFRYLPIIFALILAQIGFLGLKFHKLLQKIRIVLSVRESMKIFIAGLSLVITPAGVGTAIKSHILKKKYGNPISSTIPIVFVERLTELFAVLILLTFTLIWINSYESIIAVILGFGILFLIIILSSNNKIFTSVKNLVMRINRIKKLSLALDASQESYRKLMNKKTFFEMIGWSIIAKIFQFLAVYFVFISVGINFEWFKVSEIFHTSLVLGVISFIPSGVIVTESSMIALLIKNNIEISLATLTMIFIRIATIWFPMSIGLIALKKSDHEPSEIDDTL